MQIQKDTVVTLHYQLADAAGKRIDTGGDPLVYLHGGYGNTFPKIEAALEGRARGYAATIALAPDDAFGPRDEALVRTIAKRDFPPGVKVGGQLQGQADDGSEQTFFVTKIKGDQVLLDGNHPLAGKALRFTLRVAEIRAASAEEISHGHVHGAGGHHH